MHQRNPAHHLSDFGSFYRGITRTSKASQLAARDFEQNILLVDGFLDMRKLIDLTLNDNLIPTLKPFTIARSYGTKVIVILECARKTFLIYDNYNPCTLLAKQIDPDVPQYAQPAAPAVMMNEIDDPPNPYETVEQPTFLPQPSHVSVNGEEGGTEEITEPCKT